MRSHELKCRCTSPSVLCAWLSIKQCCSNLVTYSPKASGFMPWCIQTSCVQSGLLVSTSRIVACVRVLLTGCNGSKFSAPCAASFFRFVSRALLLLLLLLYFTLLCGVVSALTGVFAVITRVFSAKTLFSSFLSFFRGLDTPLAVCSIRQTFGSIALTSLRLASSHLNCIALDVRIWNRLYTPSSKRERLMHPLMISDNFGTVTAPFSLRIIDTRPHPIVLRTLARKCFLKA